MSFDDFERHQIKVHSDILGDVLTIACRKAGSGPPILLLHGYPQSAHIWHKVAKQLSHRYTVVASDLRGYGESSKPRGSETHIEYSKREMAADQVQVMFGIVAHDRGARVAHRLGLDYPQVVDRMMLLDILPTIHMYEHTDMEFATGYWHWFFLIQPAPGPPEHFFSMMHGRKSHQHVLWTEEDLKEYKASFFTPEGVHSSCEDYRAAATIDLDHDRSDFNAGNRLSVEKLQIFWGSQGMIEKFEDPLGVWKNFCDQGVVITGKRLDCGHYIPEEKPRELLKEMLLFFS